MTIELKLPDALQRRLERPDWPVRLPERHLKTAIPGWSKDVPSLTFEFSSRDYLIAQCDPEYRYRQFHGSTSFEFNEEYWIYFGDNPAGRNELPWADADRSIVICGGDTYGSDAWISLDYRESLTKPRVITFNYKSYPNSDAHSREREYREPHAMWFEIAPDVATFFEQIEIYLEPVPRQATLYETIVSPWQERFSSWVRKKP